MSKYSQVYGVQLYSTLYSLQQIVVTYNFTSLYYISSSETLSGNQRELLLAALHIALVSPAQEVAVAEVLHTCNGGSFTCSQQENFSCQPNNRKAAKILKKIILAITLNWLWLVYWYNSCLEEQSYY